MASRKSGIPVKSTPVAKTQSGVVSQERLAQARPSSIPVKNKKNESVKPASQGQETKQEHELQDEIKKLESEVKDKDSAINDLNEKLMERLNECRVLREENETARKNINMSSDLQISGQIKDLQNLLNEKENFIEKMLTNKHELERKFEVELDMLKNQHEVELLSLEQRLEDAHQEKRDELQTSLNNERQTTGRLRDEINTIQNQGASAEINILHEELMSTKLRYENEISHLKQQLETVKSEKDDLARKRANEKKEIDSMKERNTEEIETLRYLVQEKDILINDLKKNLDSGDTKTEDDKLYSDKDLTTKLEELRRKLATEHEHNMELANQLWRKKFEKNESTDSNMTRKENSRATGNENTDKLLEEIADLKEQLQEANELHEEQNEILETQEKEMEELREIKKEFEERYTTLYKEMETKWQSEYGESEIIEKIKSHYEMEVERLHGELEDIENENGNLKTELDLMTNDVERGHSRVGSPVRRPSLTARLDMKAEIEDYKVQLATVERDLQHALNQNERLKLENSVKNGSLADSKLEEVNAFSNKIDELQAEKEKLAGERDEFCAKLEESRKEKKKLEKDCTSREEKIDEELQAKNNEIASLKEEYEAGNKASVANVLKMKEKIGELTSKCEIAESKFVSTRESLEKSTDREQDLKEVVQELKDKEFTLNQELEQAKSRISTLGDELGEVKREWKGAKEELNIIKIKHSEEGQVAETRNKVTELENKLAQGKVASQALKVKYDKLLSENETKTFKIAELEVALGEMKTELENSKVKYEKDLRDNGSRSSGEIQSKLDQRNEEYESLSRKFEESIREIEAKTARMSEIESLLRQKNAEYETLNEQDKLTASTISSLQAEIDKQKVRADEVESLNSNLKNENAVLESKINDVNILLKQSQDKCEEIKRNYNSLSIKSETNISGAKDFEAALKKSKVECETLKENYEKGLDESNIKVEKLEKDGAQFRKQVTAFEKKVAMQEREKKALEEKVGLLDKTIEEQKKEVLCLKEKCESYDWKNTELEKELKAVRKSEDKLKTSIERNEELLSVIEDATREKNHLLAKQAQLIEELKAVQNERDKLKNEKGVYESEREQDSSEHQRKLETAQKKLNEKDRVLNETKKQCIRLEESEKVLRERVREKEERFLELEGSAEEFNKKLECLSKEKEELEKTKTRNKNLEERFEEKSKKFMNLEGRVEQINKENEKLKQQLEQTKIIHNEKEMAWKEEMARQKNHFARELKNVQENMEQTAHTDITRLNQESNENDEIRKEVTRLNEENHTLKISLDDLGIEVSKQKEEKYKVEKLKDHFRVEVQSLQERLENQHEKMSELQNIHLQEEERVNHEKSKLLETLKEYETKNTELISEIGKTSSIMKATKEKYVKLKEKFNTLAKKYKNLKQEKLNKSDVQVGPDTSIDLSLAIEDLQRSKETAEETNLKLSAELDKLREEMGRNEYQIKAVRKANVVLMKQSRCLYHESEENKRLDEEREKELEKYREMKATLQNEKETWIKERGILEEQVTKSAAETARLKRENDEYSLEKNVNQKTLGEKASECVWHSRQIEKLKNENEFLYQQGRKLQVELDFAQMKSLSRVTVKPDESLNVFDKELKKSKDRSDNMGTMKEYGTRRLSQGLSESAISSKFDEVMDFAPPVFNNEKIIGNKVIEIPNKNTIKTSPRNKDINLHISRNVINNDFATEKYLGKTYWDTLDFLKKK